MSSEDLRKIEMDIAERESSQAYQSDLYFGARPSLSEAKNKKVFDAAFERGWKAALHYNATTINP